MHRTKGFTLIELLVVISIIALLMAILIPVLSLAKEKVRIVLCYNNVKKIAMSWLMYIDDNDGLLVGADGGRYRKEEWAHNVLPNDTKCSSPEEMMNAIRTGRLYDYLKDIRVYRCPCDHRYKKAYGFIPGDGEYRSYAIADGMNGLSRETKDPYIRHAEFKRPAELFVFLEERFTRDTSQGAWHIDNHHKWCSNLALWHNNRTTLGFADGHIELHKWVDKRTILYHSGLHSDGPISQQMGNPDLEYMWQHYPRKGEN
jgi:prepilin-type N-terminal cleavage/methylation domain-containing protein/prepilin-type processing-associated H-X9-DG protein